MVASHPLPDPYEVPAPRFVPDGPPALQVMLFGAGEVWTHVDGTRRLGMQPKLLALLTRLALSPGEAFVRRDALLVLLWPEMDSASGRNALSQSLHRLRRTLGPDIVVVRGDEVGLNNEVWCDVRRFRHALDVRDLPSALALVRGPLLEAFHVSDAGPFDHWLDVQRYELRRAAHAAALTLVVQCETKGRAREATRWLQRGVEICPEDDATLQRLIRSLSRHGDHAHAIRAYNAVAARLWVELELEPSAATCALVEELRTTRDSIQPEARRAYLRARHMIGVLGRADAALASFRHALELDPEYAEAHAGVAECLATLALVGHFSREQAAAPLETSARRALELSAQLSESHMALGVGRLVFAQDWLGAEHAFRRAVELSPTSARAHGYLAFFLSTMGWLEEGVSESSRAADLDPLDPFVCFLHGFALYRARHYATSLDQLRALLELHPHHALAHMFVAENELKLGRMDAATIAARAARDLLPDDPLLTGICSCILGYAGQPEEARRMLRRLEAASTRRYVNPHFLASANAGLGELEQAFDLWESMVRDGAPGAFLLRTDPLFDPLRSEPRFTALLDALRFPAADAA